jgi:uncharacterized protein DUF1501
MEPSSHDRREFLRASALGLGAVVLGEGALGAGAAAQGERLPHFAPRARRLVYLFQSGGPSQLETFDHKPLLLERNGEELPDSVRRGQRLTGMSGNQSTLPLAGARFAFARHGASGAWVSELLPFTAREVDRLCLVKSMHTSAINHDPAITFSCTGSEIAGRPSLGAWLSYGLGTRNPALPAFVVLVTNKGVDQPLYARLWGAGFLASAHQGVQFLSGAEPVLYLANPPGVSARARRRQLEAARRLEEAQHAREGDPSILARSVQAAMAEQMQGSVPEVTDTSGESEETLALYGPDARTPGSYAHNCLLARRLLERDVRCVQLFHPGWDHHGNLPSGIRALCRETDQPTAGLLVDLARRGLLEDTLVVWGGEFGRTCYSQGKLTADDYGRDHHPRCYTAWLAGAGVRAGHEHGATDDFGYNLLEPETSGVHVHDLNATILHLFGLEHTRLVYRHQGRDFRLTDVEGRVVKELLA